MRHPQSLHQSRLDKSDWIVIKGLLLAFCFSVAGCDKPTADSLYKVIDTGYWSAQVNSLTEPLWLDNDRVAFTSSESLSADKPPYYVKVLNTRTNTVSSTQLMVEAIPFTKTTHSLRCARNGLVVYQKKDAASGQWTYYRGSLENAKEHPAPRPDMRMDERYDCDWVPNQPSPDRVPYRSKLLGKNYIEILEKRAKLYEYQKRPVDRKREQKTGENLGPEGKLLYHRDETAPGQPMPSGNVSYSEFLDAYVVGHEYYSPQWTETHSFWILQRNGDLKEVPYAQTMLEGRVDVYPLKQGYLAYYSSGRFTMTDSGDHGLYFMQGDKVQRLIVGLVEGVRISPDGCKVAFVHARNAEEHDATTKPYRTVKIINFCQGDSKP